jgi:hypothetical protein
MSLVASLGNVTTLKDTTTGRGSTYFYAVTAVNGVGEGPRSAAGGPITAR